MICSHHGNELTENASSYVGRHRPGRHRVARFATLAMAAALIVSGSTHVASALSPSSGPSGSLQQAATSAK